MHSAHRRLRQSPQPVALALIIVFLHPIAQAADTCYQLYDEKNALVYQSPEPPIDLSGFISDEVSKNFPHHHLVFSTLRPCTALDEIAQRKSVVPLPKEPLRRGPIILDSDYSWPGYSDYPRANRLAADPKRPGTEVRVRSYIRADGTYVRSHTRSRRSR
jgi:hypothetical protein